MKQINIYNFKFIKFILIFLLFPPFFYFIAVQLLDFYHNQEETNNNWIKNTDKFINYFLLNCKSKYVDEDLKKYQEFLSLKLLLKDNNSSLNLKLKENLAYKFQTKLKKNISLLRNIFFKRPLSFGNQIDGLNNVIYYCEILGIKNIYLNSKYNWYIKNDINTDKIHISLLSQKAIDCKSHETFCGLVNNNFFYPMVIKAERRSLILKNEIKKNLPQIRIGKDYLYIYIRGGDSFKVNGNNYTPAPYCFYKKILSNFKFTEIHIISMDKKSPIIRKLLLDYPYIKHEINPIEKDIATLIYAYNLVNTLSSFSQAAIAFNDNLINLFEYEVYKPTSAIFHFHYDIDKLNRTFNIYRMKPSKNYFTKMYRWKNTDEQRKLLFEEKCQYYFRKTKYTKTIFE